ncbi:MAG: archaemetzincin family Zn-dependent metalloprotease, partial [Ignisphaera sp.]
MIAQLNVLLLRTQEIEHNLLRSCSEVLYEIFEDVHVKILESPIDIPEHLYDPRRKQYHAEGVIYLASLFRRPEHYVVLLANVDAYVPSLNFVFGLAIPATRTAAVFTYRLQMWTDFNNYIHRIKKEVVHELGHLIGLNHCSTSQCVMRFSNSVFEVDEKKHLFCFKCTRKLMNRGYRLK